MVLTREYALRRSTKYFYRIVSNPQAAGQCEKAENEARCIGMAAFAERLRLIDEVLLSVPVRKSLTGNLGCRAGNR